MTPDLMAGFADELVKTAGSTSLLTKALRLASKTKQGKTKHGKALISRVAKTQSKVKHSIGDPEYRSRIRSAAGFSAAAGATTALVSDSDESALRRMLRGAVGGAVGGAVTGAAFPGWFAKSNRKV